MVTNSIQQEDYEVHIGTQKSFKVAQGGVHATHSQPFEGGHMHNSLTGAQGGPSQHKLLRVGADIHTRSCLMMHSEDQT